MNYLLAFTSLAVAVTVYIAVCTRKVSFRAIPGPPSPSWVFGNMLQLWVSSPYGKYEFAWLKEYGNVYRLKGCFGQDRLMVSDPRAVQHVLNNVDTFRISPLVETFLHNFEGPRGIQVVQGAEHRRMRTALNVAFTASAVRQYQELFENVARKISSELEATSESVVDVCQVIGAGTLAAITEVVLGRSVEELDEELVQILSTALVQDTRQTPSSVVANALSVLLPQFNLLKHVVSLLPVLSLLRKARKLATRLGTQVIEEKAAALEGGMDPGDDLYAYLLRQNTTLTKEDIAIQTPVLLIAGQDTTANTLTFGLLELARKPELQEKIRQEIHSMADSPYDNRPLLNALIKESLRMFPAEALAERIVVRDTVIPLTESISTMAGEHIDHIPVRKGEVVLVGIASYQRDKSRWGENPDKFDPLRWVDGRVIQGEAIGPYANLLSFLGGPRTCLGWRFAVMEMQTIFSELLGKFSFALEEDKPDDLFVQLAVSLQPSDPDGKKVVPLRITRLL
ncbi:cytochrome P450 [Mycena albidolilacea]|uniref:Cytochrome P450 n=1 Tax=Mycena albidolilacea TaxID=1033008 RepID=A0AAD6ZVY5_9AGAR|nr:cytochrome P450 [Mycena albidolilacea]